MGIAAATSAVVFFIAGGTLATIVVYHCISKQQPESSKPISQQQTLPEYEEIIQLSENMLTHRVLKCEHKVNQPM